MTSRAATAVIVVWSVLIIALLILAALTADVWLLVVVLVAAPIAVRPAGTLIALRRERAAARSFAELMRLAGGGDLEDAAE